MRACKFLVVRGPDRQTLTQALLESNEDGTTKQIAFSGFKFKTTILSDAIARKRFKKRVMGQVRKGKLRVIQGTITSLSRPQDHDLWVLTGITSESNIFRGYYSTETHRGWMIISSVRESKKLEKNVEKNFRTYKGLLG